MARRKLTPDQFDQIEHLAEQTLNAAQIARQMGQSRRIVNYALSTLGLKSASNSCRHDMLAAREEGAAA